MQQLTKMGSISPRSIARRDHPGTDVCLLIGFDKERKDDRHEVVA